MKKLILIRYQLGSTIIKSNNGDEEASWDNRTLARHYANLITLAKDGDVIDFPETLEIQELIVGCQKECSNGNVSQGLGE